MILDITVDDSSYRYRAIMGEHSLTLYYSLAEHVEIPVGAYCDYQGERYTLERPEALKMQHSRMFDYTVTMEAVEVLAKRWKFRNPVDGRLKFTLTAKPHEHLQMFVDNMNARDRGWTVGDCVTGVETMISYDHAYCSDALAQMAAEFKTEYEFNGKQVSLRKLEYNKDNPLPLSYGKGNGFKSGVGRTNEGDTPPIEILYTQGGSDNIDPSKYGSTELLLPIAQTLAYDGDRFEGEDGFDAANARTYATDEAGMSIRRSDKAQSTLTEDSLDCTSIYPKRVGTVSAVVTVDAEKNFYDFTDATIPQALDYEACLIAGETMTVIFQSGMLAGREFDVKYIHEATEEAGVAKAARRFEIVPQEIDGQTMPNDTFRPVPGDAYAVFHCMLPDAYVCDNATKTGASWDMFREAVRYLYENEEQRFSFTGEMDGIWSKKDWENIGGRLVLGGYIRFSDPRFQPEGVLVRIIGIKDYINKPYSPVIELSNTTVTGGVSSTLKDLVSQEVVNEERHKEALGFTKRRWRDVMETLTMMFDPEGDYFTELIKPLAVHTAQLIVGTNSQQMDFVGVRFIPNKGGNANLFAATAGKLVHFTISEKGVREWTIPATADIALREEEAYYVYAKCSRTGTEGQIICSTQQIKLEDDPNYYHFLVGILNTPYDGSRSWNPNYGYTEIAGETITTGTIKDKSGQSYFDLTNNKFRMGGKQGSLDWNVTKDDQLTLRGCLYQSPAGDVDYPEVDRGAYSDTVIYYPGDKISYNGNVYKCIKQTTAGIAPTNEVYWKILVYRGSTAFKSTVFKRSNTKPSAPKGGTFDKPVPSEWSDGVPSGEEIIWASTRIFTSDGLSPQQASWTDPQQMTDTADFDVEFSSVASPNPPVNHPNTNTQWSNTADNNTIWMATSTKKNGVWSDWSVSKIKGEKGDKGDKGAFKSTVFKRSNTKPSAPKGGTFDKPVPSEWSDGVPSGEEIIWASSCTFNADGTSTGWSDPAAQSDTATLDIEFSPNETKPSAPSGTTPFANHESEGWYDPSSANFAGKTMIWRAERKVSNGAYNGEWTITRIYGEKGEDSYTYDISPDVKSIGLDSDGNATPSSYTCTCYENANGSRVAKTAKWYAYRSNDNVSWGTAYSKQETYASSFSVTVSSSYKYYKIVAQPLDGIECYAFAFIVKDGDPGKQGLQGPSTPYRGKYSSSETYYGNSDRTDVVYLIDAKTGGKVFYRAKTDAIESSFSGKYPTNTDYWVQFGAHYDNVATDLLLTRKILADEIDTDNLVVYGAQKIGNFTWSSTSSILSGTGRMVINGGSAGGQVVVGDNMNDEVWTNLYADSANIHKLYLNGSMTATSQCTFNAGIVARGKSAFILPVGGSGIVLNIDCKTNGGTVYMQGIERGGDHSKTSEGTLRCVTIDGHNVLVLGD